MGKPELPATITRAIRAKAQEILPRRSSVAPGKYLFYISDLPLSPSSSHRYVLLSLIKSILHLSAHNEVSLLVFGKFATQDGEPRRITPITAQWPKGIENFFTSHLDQQEQLRFRVLFCEEKTYFENFSSLILQTAESQAEILFFGRGNFTIPLANRLLHPYFPCVSVLFNIENNFGIFSDSVISHLKVDVSKKNAAERAADFFQIKLPVIFPQTGNFSEEKSTSRAEESFILISAIGHDRISRALSRLSADIIERFLEGVFSVASIEWHIVGESSESNLSELNPRFNDLISAGRIKVISYVEDLSTYYEQCHAYLQPPGVTGGGRAGGIQAALAKLPVIRFNRCDADARLPPLVEDPTLESGLAHLERLVFDENQRSLEGELNFEAAISALNDFDTTNLEKALEKAKRNFSLRTTQTS